MINFIAQHTLRSYQSLSLLPLETRTDEILYIKLDMAGNSLLSTVFVESAIGSVKIDYFDFTTGFEVGERNPLKSHILMDSPSTFNKLLVTNAHDKIIAKIVITGTVRFSLYGTVVTNSVSDMDAALVQDNESINYVLAKAIPIAGVAEGDVWKFIRSTEDGYLYVQTVEEEGKPVYHEFLGLSESGVEKTLIEVIVPEGYIRRLSKFFISTNESGLFRIYRNSHIIATGRTNPKNTNVEFSWNPKRTLLADDICTVTFEAYQNRPNQSVEAFLMSNEFLAQGE